MEDIVLVFPFLARVLGSDNDLASVMTAQFLEFNRLMTLLREDLKEMTDETEKLRYTMLSCQACGKRLSLNMLSLFVQYFIRV